MEVKDLEYRMYGLVPYNISDIQKGIQFGHAVQEYNVKMNELLERPNGVLNDSPEGKEYHAFVKWSRRDKTFIILNGGTTNDTKINDGIPHGTLNQFIDELMLQGVNYAKFREPDLQNAVTAVVFLVDERVWDTEKYPDRFLGGTSDPDKSGFIPAIYLIPESEEDFEKRLGGKTNIWLREFLKQFKLA